MMKFLVVVSALIVVAIAQGDFRGVGIQQHNSYRAKHGGPNVNGDNGLHNSAQSWADYLAKNDKFEHSRSGENLYKAWGGSKDLSEHVKNAVASWYGEIKNYDFNKPGFTSGTGHFTQVVWKASTQVGIGASLAPDSKWGHRVVVAAHYNPAGNVVTADNSYFKKNVVRPQ